MQSPVPSAILRPMQSQAVTFDTHAFVKRLTKAGMPEDQAEVLSKGQADLYERLVTKEHLEQKLGALELTLRNELEKVRAELKHDIEMVRAELKHDIEQVKAELKHELDQHNAANKQALKELELTLKHDNKEMEQKLTIKLGAIVVIGITVLSVLNKLL